MPTGYTAGVADGTVTSFDQFVWSCARAFGALIMMRDDPSGAPIPESFAASTYSQKAAEAARERLAALLAMSPEEARAAADAAYQDACRRYDAAEARRLEQKGRYNAMLAEVERWQPPSSDHIELKGFMRQQLLESIDFDCRAWGGRPERMEPGVWLQNELARARRDIAYHEEEQAKEEERTAGRNRWLADLRASVPYPALALARGEPATDRGE